MKQLIILITLFISIPCFAFAKNDMVREDSIPFPERWVGHWKGELKIYDYSGVKHSLPMALYIQPIDTSDNFTWSITYGEDRVAGLRAYELVVQDRERGQFLIDEHNGIAIEAYYIDNALYNTFSVSGNMITVVVAEQGDQLRYEIFFGKDEPVSSTGGKKYEGEEIPVVKTFPIMGTQKAMLSLADDK